MANTEEIKKTLSDDSTSMLPVGGADPGPFEASLWA